MKQPSTIKKISGVFDRVGNQVSLINRGGKIQLRWTYSGRRFHLAIPGGISKAAIAAAYAKANTIAADITLNQFDSTLTRYDAEKKRPQNPQPEENIRSLWERYKDKKRQVTSPTTQKSVWVEVDRAIADLPSPALELTNIGALGMHYLKIRAAGTTHRHFEALQPAIRAAIPGIKLKEQLPKRSKKPIQFFTPEEVQAILKAFKGNHYERYVTFIAATGCRPEEVIALAPDDITRSAHGAEVAINKAFSKRILNKYTKNHLQRTIPLSALAQQATHGSGDRLLFPSPTQTYIDQHNFLGREWKPLVKSLVKSGQVRRYLPSYALRHSFITNMIYKGVPLPTIAWLVGDRVDTILRFYAGVQMLSSAELPKLYD